MKTKGSNKDIVNVITLGCSKNIVDSEVLVTQLAGNGIKAVHESTDDESKIIIINTCGFIEKAKQESIDTILRFVDAKQNGRVKKVYVTGCLSERYKVELEQQIPEVDAYFGTHELPALLRRFKADYKQELTGERKISTASHFAYLKISEGCDRPCSFCAIPLMRGKHISRPMESLVAESENLAAKGVKELIIIAQDSTYYGLDLYHKRKLAELMNRLSGINGIEWIRLHYAYPAGFPMEVIEEMNNNDKICKYLDIPLQHGSTRILQSMRRGITREKTEALIQTIREKIPDIAIRTTMITGHPGETEADFQEMVTFIEKMRFERMGVFTYSHEENTHSFSMTDDIPEEIKKERADTLMALQENISLELNQQKIGRRYKVLFDRKEGGFFIGRTQHDSPEVDNEVLVDAKTNYIGIGDFRHIKIDGAMPFDLVGAPVPDENK